MKRAEFKMFCISQVEQEIKNNPAIITSVKFNLFVSPNLDQNAYLNLETQEWKEAGVEMAISTLTGAMVGMFKVAAQHGLNDAVYIERVINDLQRGFVDISEAKSVLYKPTTEE